MSSFIMQAIPFLRSSGSSATGEFLSALEDVIEMGSRYVIRVGGTTAIATADEMLIGPAGLGIAGTSLIIRFDANLALRKEAPDHFHMPKQPSSAFRRTAFCYVSGEDRSFGMIARDDEIEPSRHFREALTEAIGNVKKLASLQGRSATVRVNPNSGEPRSGEGVVIDEQGFRSPTIGKAFRWDEIRMFEIDDRVRLTCRDAVVEVGA